jgi:hypothetical protein
MTPGSHTSLEYDALHDVLVHAGVVLALPELHGAICGALCAGGTEAALGWLEQALEDDKAADDVDHSSRTPVRDSLRELVDASFRELQGDSLTFEPLLPNDDAPLVDQVQALAAWCQGFLAALGESAPEIARGAGRASDARLADERDPQAVQANLAEILADFAEISRAGLTDDDAADRDQADFALAELKEYTRVSAQIVFEELRPRRDARSHEVH